MLRNHVRKKKMGIVSDERWQRCATVQRRQRCQLLEAITLCGANPFDAILSDVDMPKMNGHELARWVAINHPDMRCVLMSGFSLECEQCPLVGRCLLLRKPFAGTEAVAVITDLLRQRSN